MTVAYVSSFNSLDVKRAWSGTGYFMAKALHNHPNLEVVRVGPLRERYKVLTQGKQAYHRYLGGGKTHIREFEPITMLDWGRQAAPTLAEIHPDAILTPLPQIIGGLNLARVLPQIPRVIWTDATFANLVGYYERYSNLSRPTLRNGHRLWESLSSKGTHFVFSSEWAAQFAIDRYGAAPQRVDVVPFGTNLEEIPPRGKINDAVAERPAHPCRLVFLSVDWVRKGGPMALEVAQNLNDRGVNTSLTVVGCEPSTAGPLPDFVHRLGFVPKNTAEGRTQLSELLASSHFLVLPSQADCTPMVIAEANAHGLPALVRDTGGIASIVSNDVNGRLFPADAKSELYAEYVATLMANPQEYLRLARSARAEQERRLNWDTASGTVASVLQRIVSAEKPT